MTNKLPVVGKRYKDVSEPLKQIRIESHIKLNHINLFLTKKIDWVFEDSSLDDKIDLLYKYISDIVEDKIETEMTNKLPVVGKRYKPIKPATKSFCNEEIIVTFVDATITHYKVPKYNFEGKTPTDTFFYIFEELPEDKAEAEKKSDGQITTITCEKCGKSKEDNRNSIPWYDLKCRFCAETEIKPTVTLQVADDPSRGFNSETWSSIETKPETQSLELSPEVKEAMEKLKQEQSRVLPTSGYYNSGVRWHSCYNDLRDKAEKLLNALDKQFRVNETSESANVKEIEEECKLETAADEWNTIIFLTDFVNDYEKLKERVRKLESNK